MQAYLKDTEQQERVIEGDKNRKNKIRKIAYEIEDALEEFMVDVPVHFHTQKFSQYVHDSYHKFSDRRPFHRLSSRVVDIQDKIKAIKESDPFRKSSSRVASSSRSGEVPDLTYPILNNDALADMERRTNKLLGLFIKEEPRRQVISVVGSRGSGKTTLIKNVFESERAKGHFECYAWVPHPTSCKDTWEKICKEMEVRVSPGANMEQNLVNNLKNRKYLVVLDAVWKDDWCNSINTLPDNGNGSRIILSTCSLDLASKCSDDVYQLDPLPGDDAWKLFCKMAFRGSSECPKHLKEKSQDLLSKCGEQPLAIVALGSLLSTKSPTPAEFQKVLDSLAFNLERNSEFGIMKRLLEQRYFHLSHNLKRCFLYLCIFPGGYPVTPGRLIRLWIAEGFVEEKGDQALEVAKAYLNELISGSLVDANTRDVQGLVRSCQVNDLVRECLVSLSEDESFCKVLTRQNFDGYDPFSHRGIAIHDAQTDSLKGKLCFSVFWGGDN